MRNVPLKLVASLLVVATAAGPAAAQDPKNYSGTSCLGSRSGLNNLVRNIAWGRAENPTVGVATYVCPAVKDGDSIAGARAFVVDQRANASVTCTLRSGRAIGPALWFAGSSTPIPFSSPNPTGLAFGALPGAPLGHYWLTCTVPGVNVVGQPSAVVMYQITELP